MFDLPRKNGVGWAVLEGTFLGLWGGQQVYMGMDDTCLLATTLGGGRFHPVGTDSNGKLLCYMVAVRPWTRAGVIGRNRLILGIQPSNEPMAWMRGQQYFVLGTNGATKVPSCYFHASRWMRLVSFGWEEVPPPPGREPRKPRPVVGLPEHLDFGTRRTMPLTGR